MTCNQSWVVVDIIDVALLRRLRHSTFHGHYYTCGLILSHKKCVYLCMHKLHNVWVYVRVFIYANYECEHAYINSILICSHIHGSKCGSISTDEHERKMFKYVESIIIINAYMPCQGLTQNCSCDILTTRIKSVN